MKKLPKGWKITVKKNKKADGLLEASFWFNGQYKGSVPTLYDYVENARAGANVYFWLYYQGEHSHF